MGGNEGPAVEAGGWQRFWVRSFAENPAAMEEIHRRMGNPAGFA